MRAVVFAPAVKWLALDGPGRRMRAGMHWKGGRYPPPPFPERPACAQLRLPDAKCQLQWDL